MSYNFDFSVPISRPHGNSSDGFDQASTPPSELVLVRGANPAVPPRILAKFPWAAGMVRLIRPQGQNAGTQQRLNMHLAASASSYSSSSLLPPISKSAALPKPRPSVGNQLESNVLMDQQTDLPVTEFDPRYVAGNLFQRQQLASSASSVIRNRPSQTFEQSAVMQASGDADLRQPDILPASSTFPTLPQEGLGPIATTRGRGSLATKRGRGSMARKRGRGPAATKRGQLDSGPAVVGRGPTVTLNSGSDRWYEEIEDCGDETANGYGDHQEQYQVDNDDYVVGGDEDDEEMDPIETREWKFRLIDLVRDRIHLWEPGQNDHSDRDKSEASWREIANDMNCGWEWWQCRYEFRKLRIRFKNILNTLPPSGDDYEKEKEKRVRWQYFEPLEYLKDTFQPRRTSSSWDDDVLSSCEPTGEAVQNNSYQPKRKRKRTETTEILPKELLDNFSLSCANTAKFFGSNDTTPNNTRDPNEALGNWITAEIQSFPASSQYSLRCDIRKAVESVFERMSMQNGSVE